MAEINTHYEELKRAYVFPIIERKLEELKKKFSPLPVLNFGIGDVSLPLAPTIVSAICEAVQEMGRADSFRGYGPSVGYDFLKEKIAQYEYAHLGIEPDEIFISDGTNSDAANIQEIFNPKRAIAITDPTYPVYLDTNIMAGRSSKIVLLPCREETRFAPKPPSEPCDVVYLCSPNNPTGVAMNREELTEWVVWAKEHRAILLYDNAYAAFVTSPDVPVSIFEIPGAKEVAIEFRSFSKSAGFTGLRCAYTILPKTVLAHKDERAVSLHTLWEKRQSIKSNGVSYPIQRGAEAVFSEKGQRETKAQVLTYLAAAKILREGLTSMGYTCYGGADAPYIWWKTPNNLNSWAFFDLLLERCQLLSIPGSGFGMNGEGFVRLSAFTTSDKAEEAIRRIRTCL